MKKLVVHKVGISSLGKLVGVWAAILGLVVGVIGSVVSVVSVFENNNYSVLGGIGVALLVVLGWVIVYPVVMFVVGWVQGAIVAIVFNVVVAGSGGLTLDVEEGKLEVAPAKK
jgi:hypothetical protein